ncbi:chemotaxis protein CheW [Leptolyngbya sp. FACHB-671]|uniref:chemotaxis protein CheW n=1 Tax=Leptolyngbya sp. FACHB-671 TaxID=2692812 RepID=UPI0016852FB7|nr:chemotaxis protein CheW [Leptolyngbya sp. FACHB-671]MBD2069204.1 chemotaxis protein CheW [Leptolyngbya sp. FACHB-671]
MSNFLSISDSGSPSAHLQLASSAPAQDIVSASSGASEQFLRLYLFPNATVLLPIQQLSEVLTLPTERVTPIPHMPDWVMGVYNWRGEILWTVDLGHLCGFMPWYQQATNVSAFPAVILQVRNHKAGSARNQMLGLVVNRVEDIEWCDPEMIQPLPRAAVSPQLAPFLRGYWWKSGGDMLAVLDGEAIIRAMPQS